MKISENEVYRYDNMLFGWEKKDNYIETRTDYSIVQDLPSNEGGNSAFIGVYIQMDNTHKLTVRRVSTLFDAFSDSGGFMTIVYILTTVILTRFQSTIYFTSLIKSFYKYQPEQMPEQLSSKSKVVKIMKEQFQEPSIPQNVERGPIPSDND